MNLVELQQALLDGRVRDMSIVLDVPLFLPRLCIARGVLRFSIPPTVICARSVLETFIKRIRETALYNARAGKPTDCFEVCAFAGRFSVEVIESKQGEIFVVEYLKEEAGWIRPDSRKSNKEK